MLSPDNKANDREDDGTLGDPYGEDVKEVARIEGL